jgi:predicted dehydrogenase
VVGYSFRYGMARYIDDLLAQGAVGDPRAITGSIGTPPMNSRWIAQPESGGGPLLFVGCHLIDLALWFIGEEPASVWASVQYRPDTGADDTSAIQLEFSNGRIAQFCTTQSAAGFSTICTSSGTRARSRYGAATLCSSKSKSKAPLWPPIRIRPLSDRSCSATTSR